MVPLPNLPESSFIPIEVFGWCPHGTVSFARLGNGQWQVDYCHLTAGLVHVKNYANSSDAWAGYQLMYG